LARVIGVIQPGSRPEGRVIVARYTDCVRYADEIVLNKRDLCSSDEWERFRAALVRDNRKARLWQTVHAEVDPEVMLLSSSPFRLSGLLGMRHEAGQGAVFSHPSSHPMVATIPLPRPLNRARFLEWFECLPDGIERVKGFCRFADSNALHEVQFSLPAWRWVGTIQLREEPDHALVLIGQDEDWKRCGDALHSCLIETDGDMPPFRVSGVALKAVGGPPPRKQNKSYGRPRGKWINESIL
jgi:G3E family GTPase